MTTPLIERDRANAARWDATRRPSRRTPRTRTTAVDPPVRPAAHAGWDAWEACNGWYPKA